MAPRKGCKTAPLRVAPAKAAATNEGTDKVGFIPADPADPRLTVDGAVVCADGKIDIEAYEDIMACWAAEPPPDNHPDPLHPGVRPGEEIPKGLRMWDDVRAGCTGKDGAGWIAVKTSVRLGKKEKWFNIRTCRSWRLAFLFAKIQRSLWEREDHAFTVSPASRAPEQPKDAKTTPTKTTPVKRVQAQMDTPNKKAKIGIAKAEEAKTTEPQVQTAAQSKLEAMRARIAAKAAAESATA